MAVIIMCVVHVYIYPLQEINCLTLILQEIISYKHIMLAALHIIEGQKRNGTICVYVYQTLEIHIQMDIKCSILFKLPQIVECTFTKKRPMPTIVIPQNVQFFVTLFFYLYLQNIQPTERTYPPNCK